MAPWTVILTFSTLIGGLGIFLLAISLISDGLKLAAGDKLKAILERWTTTRLRAVGSGFLVTAIVQSSSAVTVAIIGFVNAGLLSLGQALGVVYGANVGTTMTGWIVAAVGFSFRIDALALPMIGLGMFVRMLRPRTRLGDLGAAVAGFGLVFIAIDLMQGGFETFAAGVDLSGIGDAGIGGLVLYVLLGMLMTVLTQSSSAAIAITLTAASGGVLPIDAAAATVIGANVGTTSTAALAAIGATANARRVAAAHVIFNFVTGAVALVTLPLMLWGVRATESVLGLEDIPAATLALFHTVFNLLGVALMWPLTTTLSQFLMRRFTTQAELRSRPQYIDANVLQTPVLAMEALNLELVRTAALTRDLAGQALSAEARPGRERQADRVGLEALCGQIVDFIPKIDTARLPDPLKGNMPKALRIVGYFEEVIGLLDDFESRRSDLAAISQPAVADSIAGFERQVVRHIVRCDPGDPDVVGQRIKAQYDALRDDWRRLKAVLLDAASRRTVPVLRLNLALEALRGTLRVAEQLTKSAERLRELAQGGSPGPAQGVEDFPMSSEPPMTRTSR